MTSLRLEAPSELNQETGRDLFEQVREHLPAEGETLSIDLMPTQSMDTRGGAWLLEMLRYARKRGVSLDITGQSGSVAEYIDLLRPSIESARDADKPPRKPGLFERVGSTALDVWKETKQIHSLWFDAVYWTLLAPFEGRGFRFSLFIDELDEMGVRAVRIVFMMNFLLGLTIGMLSAAQLATVGLDIYVADLVMIGFARELAAVMTAVVVSARTGAAIAAELATMKVQEEVDALRGMGLNVTQFLVTPKLVAMIVVLPLLTAMGMVAGVLGGSVWGILALDIAPATWFNQTLNAADLGDIAQGLLKALAFSVVIVLVGCHNGLRVSGGSRGVGLMTTRAVVMDIFLIVLIDMLFAAVFYYVLD